ncbi:hypothetical protein [Amycolatopsis sp. 195334CR]|uniref:hypothetical protein n=1 Tax=Amycolatopsis sp. 195334CR TaxID=2814588 RepID=UPI001A8CD656|nr:hypothetical protein [Amycolatopsis sp. 195334CR]MBN6040019.1 hypothetical protein [Amycolatopsis sp. 195334CR]
MLGLAAADLPEHAVAAIAHSLATEQLPPAEPLVEVLLDTVGQHELLELYLRTHR